MDKTTQIAEVEVAACKRQLINMMVVLVRRLMVIQEATNGAAVSSILVDSDSQSVPFPHRVNTRGPDIVLILDIPQLHVSASSIWPSNAELHLHAPLVIQL
jgi:hypothetical protein